MIVPTLEDLHNMDLQAYKYVPIKKEIYSDMYTPIEIVKKLKQISKHVFILESHENQKTWGRYTFIGFDPLMEIRLHNGTICNQHRIIEGISPQDYLRDIVKDYCSAPLEGFPSFTGGLVGYFSFDYLQYSEPTLMTTLEDEGSFQDMDVMLFDKVICFDHELQKMILIVNCPLEHLHDHYPIAIEQLNELEKVVKKKMKCVIDPLHLQSEFQSQLSQDEYCQMVIQGKHHIKEGDVFQVVLSNRIFAKATGSLFDTYRILRTTNPSPYMFYFSSDTLEVAGASPETLVKKENQTLTTFPIAGTRKRGKDEKEDQLLIDDLLQDEKELAEHNMLVDLGRNDISRVSKPGTVRVVQYLEALKFSKVIHLASVVEGQIDKRYDAFDVIDALLPAGTLSGAPKIKACQIIHDLEKRRRGIYGGAVGYIDFKGNMDLCIGIRLVYKCNNEVSVCSGAGIVYDSIPENEYQECLNKASAVVEALKMANGGIDR